MTYNISIKMGFRTFTIIGPRIINQREDLTITVLTKSLNLDHIENFGEINELLLELEGEKSGDIDDKIVSLDFDKKQITFDVSFFQPIQN